MYEAILIAVCGAALVALATAAILALKIRQRWKH